MGKPLMLYRNGSRSIASPIASQSLTVSRFLCFDSIFLLQLRGLPLLAQQPLLDILPFAPRHGAFAADAHNFTRQIFSPLPRPNRQWVGQAPAASVFNTTRKRKVDRQLHYRRIYDKRIHGSQRLAREGAADRAAVAG